MFDSKSLESKEIGGEDGLVRQYEHILEDGSVVAGRHYYAAHDGQVFLIIVESAKGDFDRFVQEFEAIADSFAFLP